MVTVKTPKYWLQLSYDVKAGYCTLCSPGKSVPRDWRLDAKTKEFLPGPIPTDSELLTFANALQKGIVVVPPSILFKVGNRDEPTVIADFELENKKVEPRLFWIAEGKSLPAEMRKLTPESIWSLRKQGKLTIATDREIQNLYGHDGFSILVAHKRLGWKTRIFLLDDEPISNLQRMRLLNTPRPTQSKLDEEYKIPQVKFSLPR